MPPGVGISLALVYDHTTGRCENYLVTLKHKERWPWLRSLAWLGLLVALRGGVRTEGWETVLEAV